jgi:hypothetical protein
MSIEVKGLAEVIRRFERFPEQRRKVIRRLAEAVLLKIWESVPSYPPQKPVSGNRVSFKTRAGEQVGWGETAYDRTGQLGRSLGSSEVGGKSGEPDIYEIKENGGFTTARFGTNLEYAEHVIGDREDGQARHMKHWWTIPQTLRNIATMRIDILLRAVADDLAAWLNAKGA